MYIVYVLYNLDRRKTYVGKTTDLDKRLKRHNKILPSKHTSYTSRNSGTWIVIHNEMCTDSAHASMREKWYKSGVGRAHIKNNLSSWITRSMGDPPEADF